MKGLSVGAREIAVPIGLLLVVGCMIIPLPPAVLDVLLCSNLLFALLLVIGALHIRDPLRLATLPSLLLMATLFRLSLNLATTRAVLGSGHAGKAVEAFGSVVIQGNLAVGFVLFLLLTMIQFIVVAKGAERVAEVSARFTLDAMPGKQMAIDAELRGGILTPEQARRKRFEVQAESRFYGALDGAMKFVKGDAIAGLIITFVNIAGGLLVGLLLHDLELEAALRRYTILTIGDGLLSQIPSLLNSVAAGLVVTRVQVDEASTLSSDLLRQLGEFRAARAFVAGASLLLGALPGMPHLALLSVSGIVAASLVLSGRGEESQQPQPAPAFEPTLANVLQIEVSSAWVSSLPPLPALNQALDSLRSHAFSRWGLVLLKPGVSLLEHETALCRILVRGMEVFRADGEPSMEEWERLLASAREMIDLYRAELIDDGATRRALDCVERQIPDLVTGVVPSTLSLTQLTAVLRGLLREGITARHMDVVLQAIADSSGRLGERALLAEVRCALAPVVSAAASQGQTIKAVVLDPLLDLALSRAEESGALLGGELLDLLCESGGERAVGGTVLLSSKRARAYLRDTVRARYPEAAVLAHEEIAPRYSVEIVGKIEIPGAQDRERLLAVTLPRDLGLEER